MPGKFFLYLAVAFLITAGNASEALSYQKISALPDESGFLPKEQRVCSYVQENIRNGKQIKSVVKTSIQMGYNACLVVKCAVNAGGDINEILSGALEAGATSDVVARCAIDAGASIAEVLKDLRSAGSNICYVQPLGYSEPPGNPPGPIPPPPPPPPPISPYRP